jgi:DNA invertase Pin-like site-specific DNA recombinase
MLVGYKRVSKSDGSQKTDLQHDALIGAGVKPEHIYEDMASGAKADRPGLEACLKSLRPGDTLVVYRIDRLGRTLLQLLQLAEDLKKRGVGLKILAGVAADLDTTTSSGKLVFSIMASLAEWERELINSRTRDGLDAARARGKVGGRKPKMTVGKLRTAMLKLAQPETKVMEVRRRAETTETF